MPTYKEKRNKIWSFWYFFNTYVFHGKLVQCQEEIAKGTNNSVREVSNPLLCWFYSLADFSTLVLRYEQAPAISLQQWDMNTLLFSRYTYMFHGWVSRSIIWVKLPELLEAPSIWRQWQDWHIQDWVLMGLGLKSAPIQLQELGMRKKSYWLHRNRRQ